MMHFLKGGDWQRRRDIAYLCASSWEVQWEHLPIWKRDIEGLPDRWVEILMGKTNWIPKIVFEMNAKRK